MDGWVETDLVPREIFYRFSRPNAITIPTMESQSRDAEELAEMLLDEPTNEGPEKIDRFHATKSKLTAVELSGWKMRITGKNRPYEPPYEPCGCFVGRR